MKIIVTGCFGFIGYNFINYLQKNYHDQFYILGIDSLESDCSKLNSKNFIKNDNFEFYNLDICEVENSDLNQKGADAVINFAAESHVDNSISNPEKFIKSNVLGASKIFKYSLNNDIDNNIHISTDEVYGSSEKTFFNEDDILNPSSPYSASKASAEMVRNAFVKTYDMNINVFRPANNYGILQQPEKLIPFSIINLLKGKNIEIYGEGKNIRHWLHVEDTCSAIFKVLVGSFENEIFNIGSGEYMRNIDIANIVLDKLELDVNRLDFVPDRPGHDFRYAVNFSKLESTGWKPQYTIENSIGEIVDWYRQNEKWWEKEYKTVENNRLNRFKIS